VRFSAAVRAQFVLGVVSITSLDTCACFSLLFTSPFDCVAPVSPVGNSSSSSISLPASKKPNRESSALRSAMACPPKYSLPLRAERLRHHHDFPSWLLTLL
jgi:hypothetical protein